MNRHRNRPFEEWSVPGPGCWEWNGYRNPQGYGKFRKRLAHRVAWEREHGPIPPGMHVCHHCDNPACVRPNHLFLGTAADNHADKSAKGRVRNGFSYASGANLEALRRAVGRPGEPARKISDSDVIEIRQLRAAGWSQRSIGQKFGVAQNTISLILNGRAAYARRSDGLT